MTQRVTVSNDADGPYTVEITILEGPTAGGPDHVVEKRQLSPGQCCSWYLWRGRSFRVEEVT